MFNKKTVRDVDVVGKIVLERVDYNVPIDGGVIVDDFRVRESLATIKYLLGNGAKKIVLLAHMGRPDGERKEEFSLAPVAVRLSDLLHGEVEVGFCAETIGEKVTEAVNIMGEGSVLLLENVRFDAREEENSMEFAQAIVDAVKPDLFVEDGFGVVHRAHSSTEAITHLLPSVAGLLLEKEVSNLSQAQNPVSPSLAIIGGAKVEDKAPLIERFVEKYDKVAIGGKIANEYKSDNPKIVLATDFVYGEDGNAYDIGPESAQRIADMMEGTKTVLWNGILGMAEDARYAHASEVVAEAMGMLPADTITVVAGGDTTGFVENYASDKQELHYSLLSTGGGAALEFLLGEKLPGIEALEDK